jgi:CRISPR-associated Csx2 family protein
VGTLLVTVLGTNPKSARYTLDGRYADAVLAPLALVKLVPEAHRPDRVLALCTDEAREQSWPLLERGLTGSGIQPASVSIRANMRTDSGLFLKAVAESIPPEDAPTALMFDVTHGFRHLALLTLLAVQYISALRHNPLLGAYYGMWQPIDEGASPFLDLQPLLTLPEWIHAVRVFDESGDASLLAALIGSGDGQGARGTAKHLRQVAEARVAGLPIELGRLSATFRSARRKPFMQALKARGALLEEELWRLVEEPLVKFARETTGSGQSWKRQIELTEEELVQHAIHVDDLLDHGSVAVALGLMNEWTVSWAMLRLHASSSWLDYSSGRRTAANILNSLAALTDDQELGVRLSDGQRRLGRFWRELSDLRNAFHHHGMRYQVLIGTGDSKIQNQLGRILEAWNWLKAMPDIPLTPPATGTLLVSPIGRRPGVLYSAVDACRRHRLSPEACLVLCSEETEGVIDEAMRRVGFEGQVYQLRIADPYGGQSDIKALVKTARAHIIGAQEVAVNITGGTTLMGLAVSAIADEAQRLARDVRRFGLVDRRPPSEQDADPFQVGEPFWLDPWSDNGA